MKTLLFVAVLAALSACNLTTLPQAHCSDGHVLHTSAAGTERCIKPGMAVGDGVIESGLVLGLGVAAVSTGVIAP